MQFQDAFAAWIATLATIGVDAPAHLNPPATDSQIAAFEEKIDLSLSPDLRALYSLANGQQDPWGISDVAPGKRLAPLFGSYVFLSLNGAAREYQAWKDIRDQSGDDFNNDYNDTLLRAGDPPVHAEYWNPGWVPFAADGSGNNYAVDMAPPEGGRMGQIIVFGADENVRKVFAPDLATFLADAAARGISDANEIRAPLVLFSMEP